MISMGRSLVRGRGATSFSYRMDARARGICLCRSFSASNAQSDMGLASGSDGMGGEGEKDHDSGHNDRSGRGMPHLPERTVPDEALRFKCRGYIGSDTGDRYPNVHGIHPAEFKVELKVVVDELGLPSPQKDRLKMLVGPRYNPSKDELRLISERFPNRIDNKRYLVTLLEKLVLEARKVDA
ncbi:unnamed protein product [Choristocarpus tenellus]